MSRPWLLVLPLLAGSAVADDAANVFERVGASVVTVTVLDEAGRPDGQGSGVVIAPARVVTNCHVVRDSRTVSVVRGKQEFNARWSSADLPRDLCVLDVAGLDAPAARARRSDSLAIGERVFAVGNPLGFGLAVSEGLVSTIAAGQDERRIYTSAALSPGSSGGGLFDADGRLVGITTGILSLGQNLNVVLPAEWIDELSVRAGKAPAIPETPAAEPHWAGEADVLYGKGDWSGLESWAGQWLAVQPDSPNAWRMVGLAQHNLGKLAEAEKSQRSSLALWERNPAAWTELGLTLAKMGRKEETADAFRRAVSVHKESGYPQRELARLYFFEAKYEDARKQIVEATRLSPGDDVAWTMLGEIEERRGDPEVAVRAYRIALRHRPDAPVLTAALARTLVAAGRGDRALEMMAQSSGATGIDAAGWFSIGMAELNKKRLPDAESAFRKALDADAKWTPAWAGLAAVQFATGRAAEAEASVDRALAIRPDDLDALSVRADRRAAERNFQAARALYEKIVTLDPKRVAAWRWLANMQMETRDFRGAEESFRHLLALTEPQAGDLLGLGNTCVRLGKLDEAETALLAAERLDPKEFRVPLALAAVYGGRGDNERSLAMCERAIAAQPGLAEAWSCKGHVLTKLQRYDGAVQALETAVSLGPDLSNSWINYGQALLMKRQLGKAIAALERAIVLSPQAVDAHLYLAQAYLASKQLQRGRSSLDRLLEIQPNLTAAWALLTTLNLIEGKSQEAQASFMRLKAKSPFEAARFRATVVARGLPGATKLPE